MSVQQNHISVMQEWAEYPLEEYSIIHDHPIDKEIAEGSSCVLCGGKCKYIGYRWLDPNNFDKYESYIALYECVDCKDVDAF